MTTNEVRDEIKLLLTGQLLELEVEDTTLDSVISSSIRELQRYLTLTKIITVPFSSCIDLSTATDEFANLINVDSVARIYRTNSSSSATNATDPMSIAQYQLVSGLGSLSGFQDYAYNYMSWNTINQIKNTTSTDLAFKYDKQANKLYINVSEGMPSKITIEYVPKIIDVSEIESSYWLDVLLRIAVAKTKIVVGRIRSRYTQANALWTQDGNTLLQEGTQELETLRQTLESNTALFYHAID